MLYHEHEKLSRPIRSVLGYLHAGPKAKGAKLSRTILSCAVFPPEDPLAIAQELFHSRRPDGVVPSWRQGGWGEIEFAESGGGGLDADRVVFPIQTSSHDQSGGGGGGANELQDGLVAFQWFTFPVPADLAQ